MALAPGLAGFPDLRQGVETQALSSSRLTGPGATLDQGSPVELAWLDVLGCDPLASHQLVSTSPVAARKSNLHRVRLGEAYGA